MSECDHTHLDKAMTAVRSCPKCLEMELARLRAIVEPLENALQKIANLPDNCGGGCGVPCCGCIGRAIFLAEETV